MGLEDSNVGIGFIKGKAEQLNEYNVPIVNGQIIIAEDTGDIYLDNSDRQRIVVGGGNKPGQKTVEGGEIFNNYEDNVANDMAHAEGNHTSATAQAAHAEGSSTQAGFRGWRVKIIDVQEDRTEFSVNFINSEDETIQCNIDIPENSIFHCISETKTYFNCFKAKSFAYPDHKGIRLLIIDNTIISDFNLLVDYKFIIFHETLLSDQIPECRSVESSQHTEGDGTYAIQDSAHAEGIRTKAVGRGSHAEGRQTVAYYNAHAEGGETKALGQASHSEGYITQALGNFSHAEGNNTNASGDSAHAEGRETIASGKHAHAEGVHTKASGFASHAEGSGAELGNGNITYNIAQGAYSHVEGYASNAIGSTSHAEGETTWANGICSHTEGIGTSTGKDAKAAHAEGISTVANGTASHAGGSKSETDLNNSFAHGQNLALSGYNGSDWKRPAVAFGQYNEDKANVMFMVGNGNPEEGRKNAFEVYEDGHAEVQTINTEKDKAVITLESLKKFLVVSNDEPNPSEYPVGALWIKPID